MAPSRQGRGISTAAVAVLVERARAAGVTTVSAHTLGEEGPSTSVLRKSHFVRTSEIDDPETGVIWRWERTLVAEVRHLPTIHEASEHGSG